LPPFTLEVCFWDESLDWARGRRRASRKHRRAFFFPLRNQKGFRNERRKASGPASSHGKTYASWFREAQRCPRAPAEAPKYLIPLCFFSEGGQGVSSGL